MQPTFEPTDDGLEIIDPIERHRYRLTTHEPVSPEPIDSDQIPYPVDTAVEISATILTLPTTDTVYVRDSNGVMTSEVHPHEQVELSGVENILDISSSMKLYIKMFGSVNIYSDAEQTHISAGRETRLFVGARSYHTRPAGTIKTTDQPEDLAQAISSFGSAMKTTTAERSYPTLRGHPPTLQIDNKLSIPNEFNTNGTDITFELPADLQYLLPAAPLVYYLSGSIEISSSPCVVIGGEDQYSICNGQLFEKSIQKMLKKVFFLDCITRTEGPTPLPLNERREIEQKVDFDISEVYRADPVKQLKLYLQTPFEVLRDHLPKWNSKARVKPSADSIEFLPFLSNNLSLIDVVDEFEDGEKESHSEAIELFTRSSSDEKRHNKGGKSHNMSQSPTIQQMWEDSDGKMITSTVPLTSFYNNIAKEPKVNPIQIDVICNDFDMNDELKEVNEFYGNDSELPFNVRIHHELSTDDLEAVLANESDFFHYIGHIDERGFQCLDGKLDAANLSTVGAKAFLLNACQSYDQGLHLVESGSIGGIVTLGNVVNSGAVQVGSTIANLLNRGFPIYAALDIVRKQSFTGKQYRIVGDALTTIAQSKRRTPILGSVNYDESGFQLNIIMYAAGSEKGSIFSPYLESIDSYYLLPGETGQIQVSESKLRNFFDIVNIPVLIQGDVFWSDSKLVDRTIQGPG